MPKTLRTRSFSETWAEVAFGKAFSDATPNRAKRQWPLAQATALQLFQPPGRFSIVRATTSSRGRKSGTATRVDQDAEEVRSLAACKP